MFNDSIFNRITILRNFPMYNYIFNNYKEIYNLENSREL